MCRNDGQSSHRIVPLPTMQYWVPGGTRKVIAIISDIAAAKCANAEVCLEEMRL